MFENIKSDTTRNFRDIKLWIMNIGNSTYITPDQKSIEYGLFFVYLYGLYEEIVRRVVSDTIQELNQANIRIDQCSFDLFSLVFAPDYDALRDVGSERKWEKRWAISKKMIDNDLVQIEREIFPTDGKNLRYRQLESIAKSFGLQCDILPCQEVGGYIQELVTNRNDIAHGNKLPKEIGRQYTLADLIKRITAVSDACTYTIQIYEDYITNHRYLRHALLSP